jgi:hypothetical protein
MLLTEDEILLILDLLEEKHGRGYSKELKVAGLQAKLSIMLEAKQRVSALRLERQGGST